MKKWLWLICFVPTLHAQDKSRTDLKSDWTWTEVTNGGYRVRTFTELDDIVQGHEKWLADDTVLVEERRHDRYDSDSMRGIPYTGKFIRRANLSMDLLKGAVFIKADLRYANFYGADLRDSRFDQANLSDADLEGTNLGGAHFQGADLSGAKLSYAKLGGAIFEPRTNPAAESIAYAEQLGYMKWISNPGPIVALRKSLLEAGFIRESRQINAAIHRHDQGWLELLFFDWTCEWGANSVRPLGLLALLSLFCTVIYWAGMNFSKRSRLYLIAGGYPVKTGRNREHVLPIRIFRHKFRALRTAFLFSMMSVLNIGYGEFKFGRWVHMIQAREFDIRARGWLRTVSGIQSLLGVALIALSLLSYLGKID